MDSKKALDKLFMACDNDLLYEQSGIMFATELTNIIEQDLTQLENIKKWVNDKLDYLDNGIFLVADDYLKGAIRILLELKEVLIND